MHVWAAVDESHDGIVDIRLFVREMDAKSFVRQVNKKIGFKLYEYRVFDVHDSVDKAVLEDCIMKTHKRNGGA